jgi:GTPase Era involved in 16S rRNA processing
MSSFERETKRILVFGSPSVGKTSMINMLTNQSRRIYNSSLSRPFEYENVEYTHSDNKAYIFTDTTGIMESNTFNENTVKKLKAFLQETEDKRYDLIIHVQKKGRIFEDAKVDYDLIVKTFFGKCKSLCVITFAENNMNWWSQNKQYFLDNKMEYDGGISICSSFVKEEGIDIFQTEINKSKEELWKLIEENQMPEGVIPYRDISSQLTKATSSLTHKINNIIHDYILKTEQQKVPEFNMLVIFDSNEFSIEFLYGFLKMNIEKTWGGVYNYKTGESMVEMSTKYFKFEIKFIDIDWFKVDDTREQNWRQTFKFLVGPQNSIYNCKLIIKLWSDKSGSELDEVFNLIENSFVQNNIKTVEKKIKDKHSTIFDAIPNLNSFAECQIEYNQKFWDKFCIQKNFLNDVDLLEIEIKINDCILMCNSSNEINVDLEKKLEKKGWKKKHDTFSDSFRLNENGYVGVAYLNFSGFII